MKPIIIAHRGNNFSYPENTLAGLRSAYELGCTSVEFDIQMTADETLIVMHDASTLRTSGIDKSVLSNTYQALAEISVHEPKRMGEKHKPTPISRLDEVMLLLSEFTGAHAYIEVKEESLEKWGRQKVLDKLLPIVNNHIEQCTIISFDLPVLELIREQSNLAIGWVLYHYDEASLVKAKTTGPDFLIVDQAKLKFDTPPWAGTWKWMVYGVESADIAFKHYANGVDYVETDYLDRLLTDDRLKPS